MSLHPVDQVRLDKANRHHEAQMRDLTMSLAKKGDLILWPADVAELKVLSDRIDANLGRIDEIKRRLEDQAELLQALIQGAEADASAAGD